MALLTILNAITSAPVAGANVFVVYTVGGQVTSSSLVSDAQGRVTLGAGSAALTVSASGFVTNTGTDANTEIALTPAAPAGVPLNFNVEPTQDQTNSISVAPSSGSTISFQDQLGSQPEKLTVGSDGTVLSVRSYPPGTYTATVTNPNFNTLVQTVTIVAGQVDVLLTLSISTTAPAETTAAAVSATANQLPAAPAATATSTSNSDAPYEYIYPNSVDGKYFQATQARMYIGQHFVDELNLCQWMGANNRIPIYGYRSNKFDAVGRGRSLVQGQLAVNFISEGYMYILLKEFQKKISSNLSTSTTLAGVPTSLQTQINSLVQQRSAAISDGRSTSTFDSLLVTAGKSSPQAATYISSVLASGNLDASGSVITAGSITHQNAIYLDIPFDIVVNLEGAGRTVTKTLKNCFLGANDFSFAHDGKTLLDTYSFIAREVS